MGNALDFLLPFLWRHREYFFLPFLDKLVQHFGLRNRYFTRFHGVEYLGGFFLNGFCVRYILAVCAGRFSGLGYSLIFMLTGFFGTFPKFLGNVLI